jgi:hypothetical protein
MPVGRDEDIMNTTWPRRPSIGTGRVVFAYAFFLASPLLLTSSVGAQPAQLLYREDFEHGWNGWINDTANTLDPRFAWVIGRPTKGPAAARGGANCAGMLDPGTDCYLVSPPLLLPAVNQYSNHLWLFY